MTNSIVSLYPLLKAVHLNCKMCPEQLQLGLN